MAAADQTNADSRHHLAGDGTPPPISKDMQGTDNSVPLSPQWLLPKYGDNKLGIVTGESHFSPHSGTRPDVMKASGNGEDFHDSEKNKDVSRPSLYDADSGRRSRWRDEERETNSAIRRDRWREGDKELGDVRRPEPWVDSSTRYSAEARRVPSDRWTDSASRENNHDQRRESKWNTRWGPDDKESESWREKWSDYGRDNEGSRDKGTQLSSHAKDINNHVKEGGEGDTNSRSWRSNSFLSRGRGEILLHQSPAPNKPAPFFAYGRGRGENGTSVFPAGRGRVSSGTTTVSTGVSRSYSVGAVSEKSDAVHGDPSTIRYSRMKLLDIYRMTDVKSHRMYLEGFVDVPSLTVAEPVDPLALSAPTPEESVILNGIDKGDIVSSGLPQVSKDGSIGRNAMDLATPKQTKLGSREDHVSFSGDHKDENRDPVKGDRFSYPEGRSNEKHSHQHGLERKAINSQNFHPHQENSTTHEALRPEVIHLQKDIETDRKSSTSVASPYYRDEAQWQSSENVYPELMDSRIKRQTSGVLDQQREGSTLYGQNEPFIPREKSSTIKFQSYSTPEDLSLYYKDPHGQIQGPFSGSDLIGWFESGYFGIDLQVRLVNAPASAPFSSLGDVMPHLKMKARPPPGFGASKQNDAMELPSRVSFGSLGGNIHSSVSEFDHTKNGHTIRHEGVTEAENRFLESLMSGNLKNPSSEQYSFIEGRQGYNSGGPGGIPLAAGDGGVDMNYLLAQRMALERQRSLPSPHPYWPGRDPSSMGSKADMVPQSPTPHSKLLPPHGDSSRQVPQPPQHVDLLSILQAAAEKSPPPPNSTGPVWSNFPDSRPVNNTIYGGMDQHITPQTGFGPQQHRLPPQNQPSLTHLMTQPGDVSSGLIPPEITNDPQMVNLLQQQYLLSQLQLHTQPPVPNQLSLLDKILLLKQQEQHQQQQLLLQQQQHLRSQTIPGQQPHQHFGEASYGHPKASMPTGNSPADHLGLHQVHEAVQINQQMSNLNLFDGRALNYANLNLQGSQDVSYKVSSPPSLLPLPRQMFDHTAHSKEWGPPTLGSIQCSDSKENCSLGTEASEKIAHDAQENAIDLNNYAIQSTPCQTDETMIRTVPEVVDSAVSLECTESSNLVSTIPGQVDDVKFSAETVSEECHFENLGNTIQDMEVREVKKSSEKKSRKQKKPKAQTVLDLGKISTKTVPCLQSHELYTEAHDLHVDASLARVEAEDTAISVAKPLESQRAQVSTSINMSINEVETVEGIAGQREIGRMEPNAQTSTSHRAWKPAPGLKAKSLLEIQLEEQQKAQTERVTSVTVAVAVPTSISPTPWSDVVAPEHRSAKDVVQGLGAAASAMVNAEKPLNSKSRKSQLHDLLAEEVLAKANEGDIPVSDDKSSFLPPQVGTQIDVPLVDDDDFVEAKDTKKGRKKAAKAKGVGIKPLLPVASADFPAPVSTEKAKNTRQLPQEKELLSVPPAGPSLADFVFWKGEQATAVPAPAWSIDSGKHLKPTSLRDIQKEQGRKTPVAHQQIPIPPVNHGSRGSGSSRQVPGSSPSKPTSPILTKAASMQTSSVTAAQSKPRTEDDLFWGPLDQSKAETKQSEFPSLANSGSLGGKGTTGKGAPGAASNRQKPFGSRPSEYVMSSSPSTGQSKGRRDESSKVSEAMDFRDWCETEWVRLTGTTDTSFLEYCLKQSTAEAEMLLRENLGSLDRNHEFMDKFLNYKDFLSSDVIEIAFQPQNSRKGTGGNAGAARDADGDTGGGGKKKGKKGKKVVNAAVLGFNVVSNRIMMGEIQTIED